jgi:hypothetical protein
MGTIPWGQRRAEVPKSAAPKAASSMDPMGETIQLGKTPTIYHLVMTNIAMENHHTINR